LFIPIPLLAETSMLVAISLISLEILIPSWIPSVLQTEDCSVERRRPWNVGQALDDDV
jgi:hypothetical protein